MLEVITGLLHTFEELKHSKTLRSWAADFFFLSSIR